jgi:CBS-domain-containing membrane protein
MSEYVQVECPGDGSHQVVELESQDGGRPCVAWCSRELSCPSCNRGCLKQLKNVSFIMMSEVPRLQWGELGVLSIDQVLEKFEDCDLERIPVLDHEKLVGALSLRKLAFWKDARAATVALSPTSEEAPQPSAVMDSFEERVTTLSLNNSWHEAVDCLLENHCNEAFVVDDAERFVGLIYARQLLRIAAG